MNWNLSTFRQAGIQTILLFYGSAVFFGIALQHLDMGSVSVGSEFSYVALIAGLFAMIIYANQVMGWSVPRPVFFILTGSASIYAMKSFKSTGFTFGAIILSAFVVIAALIVTWIVVDRFLAASNKRAREIQQQEE